MKTGLTDLTGLPLNLHVLLVHLQRSKKRPESGGEGILFALFVYVPFIPVSDIKSEINRATLKWSQSSQPRGTALQVSPSNLWNVQTGQNDLCSRPKATPHSKQLLAKI